jgi:hypothetical protein
MKCSVSCRCPFEGNLGSRHCPVQNKRAPQKYCHDSQFLCWESSLESSKCKLIVLAYGHVLGLLLLTECRSYYEMLAYCSVACYD